MVEPHSSNFRVITTIFLGVQIFRNFTVVVIYNVPHMISVVVREGFKPYWKFSETSHLKKVLGLSGHCLAGVLEQGSMDNVHWVYGQCPLSPWTMSTDNVHSVHGQCPLRPWTMSTESMDNVHWIHGQWPLSPWTFSLRFPYTLFGTEL